jgi:hypothetical protein
MVGQPRSIAKCFFGEMQEGLTAKHDGWKGLTRNLTRWYEGRHGVRCDQSCFHSRRRARCVVVVQLRRSPSEVDPNKAVVGTGGVLGAGDERGEGVGRLGPKDARGGDSQIRRGQDVVEVEVARSRFIGGILGVLIVGTNMRCVGATLEASSFGGAAASRHRVFQDSRRGEERGDSFFACAVEGVAVEVAEDDEGGPGG